MKYVFIIISCLIFSNMVAARASSSQDEEQIALCKKGYDLVESMVSDPDQKVSAWMAWAPYCRETGFYHYYLGVYHLEAKNPRQALSAHQMGVRFDDAYQEKNQAAMERLEIAVDSENSR